jgi:hypothetical protein
MKTLDGNKLQSTNTALWIVPSSSKTQLTGLYLFNSSVQTLTYLISILMASGKQLTIFSGQLLASETAQLFAENDSITLKAGESLQGRCNEATDIIEWTLFGESVPLT